jgi:hypothetical protein
MDCLQQRITRYETAKPIEACPGAFLSEATQIPVLPEADREPQEGIPGQ